MSAGMQDDRRVTAAARYLTAAMAAAAADLDAGRLRLHLRLVLDAIGDAAGTRPARPAQLAAARAADAAVAAFIAAGPDGAEGWAARRGDVAMEAAHELGALLMVLDAAPPALTRDDTATVLAALQDAAEYRTERAAQFCDDCSRHPAGACETHVDDLDAADGYRQLAARIEAL